MRSNFNPVAIGPGFSGIIIAVFVLGAATGTLSAGRLKGSLSKGTYTSPRGLFSVRVPEAPNFARVPYQIQEATEAGEKNYDTVVFYVKDFGQVMLASVRQIPQAALDNMAKDEPENVLKNLAQKALYDWRQGFPEEPQPFADDFVSTPHGQAILRLYSAPRGSLLQRLEGGSGKGPQPFDAVIAVMLVKKNDLDIYAIAEDDYGPVGLEKRLKEFFASITVPDRPRFEKR
jgi:hypothetical protein